MVTAILAGILTVNTLNPHDMEYCTFSAGFSSSSRSLSSSSSLCPWLRAAKMFPPWKRPEMLYTESACECCWWRRSSRVFVSADKPFSYFLYWRQWLWKQKISTLKQRHTLYEEKEWYCFRNIPESSSLASTESFDSVNMTFSSSASSPFPFRRSFFFFWGLKKVQMLQVVRILKTLFLVLYLEFKTSLSLVTPVLFQQGCLTYRQEDGLLHHMLLNELEFNVKKCGGGQTKKTAYAIQFPILVRCSCLFARVKLQKVNAVLFSVLVEHLHVMLITCFPCMSFTGTTSTFSALLSVASSSKNWRKTHPMRHAV